MFTSIYNYFLFSLSMLSLLVFVDILVKFNRNFPIKLSLIGIVVSTLIISLGLLYCNLYGYNIYLIETGWPFYIISLINFFWILYKGRLGKKLVLLEVFLISFTLAFLIFLDSSHKETEFQGLVDLGKQSTERSLFRIFIGLSISLLIPYILIKIIKEQISEYIYHQQFKKWSYYLILSLPLAFITIIFFSNFNYGLIYSNMSLSLAQFMILLFILFRPRFLNQKQSKKSFKANFNLSAEKHQKNALFNEFFYTKFFYLNKNASAEELASLLSITTEDLHSYVIHQYNMSLVDLINKNRVHYFIDMLTNSKSIDDNLDILSQKAGFSSRHHLSKPFKKFHGGSPSDFIRSISKN